MFSFKRKRIIYPAVLFALLIFISTLIPPLRKPLLDSLKVPLGLFMALRVECAGIIFYHRNMVQNVRIRKEVEALQQRLNYANEAYLENKRLKGALNFKEKAPYKVIAARVIGHSADNWSSVLIIDKGSYNGIKRGFVAITHLGLAGRVLETSTYTSRVMLINDPNLSVSAIVQRSRQEGLVSGTLGNSLIMRYLPLDADVKVLDTVITSGLTALYPKGLLIGTITSVGEEFSGLNRYCIIKPAVNLASLEEVLVIVS